MMNWVGIILGLLAGVLLPHMIHFYKNNINEDDYFKKNGKVLLIKCSLETFFAAVAFGMINGIKTPPVTDFLGAIVIGNNGLATIEKWIGDKTTSHNETIK